MLWNCYFESDKNGLREEAGIKQRLRTQVQNIENKKLLPDVEIGEIVGVSRAKDDVEAFNEKNDEVVGDLEVAIE